MSDRKEFRGLEVGKGFFGAKILRISRRGAEFPKRCIFTNEPVDHLTPMKIHEIRKSRISKMITEQLVAIDLPVSPAWLERRANMKALIGRIIFRIGLVGVVCFIVSSIVPESILGREPKIILGGIFGAVSVLGIILGLAWPKLEGSEADPHAVLGHIFDDIVVIQQPPPCKEFFASLDAPAS